jgi:hypothetical protein
VRVGLLADEAAHLVQHDVMVLLEGTHVTEHLCILIQEPIAPLVENCSTPLAFQQRVEILSGVVEADLAGQFMPWYSVGVVT